jgi:hypothetical protein
MSKKAHGRIEQRIIEVLPAEALGPHPEWPSIAQIAKVERRREVKRKGQWAADYYCWRSIACTCPKKVSGRRQGLLFSRSFRYNRTRQVRRQQP